MTDLTNAIKQVCEEKGLSYDAVISTIESALSAAYRKDYGKKNQNIKVEFNDDITKSKVFDVKTVVEDMPEELEEDSTEDEGEKAKDDNKENKSDDKSTKNTKTPSNPAGRQKQEETEEKKEKKDEEKDNDESGEGEEEEERKFNSKTEIQISDAKIIKKTAKIGDEIKMKLEVPEEYGRMAAQTAKQVIIQRLREAEREMVFNEFKNKEKEVVSGVVQRREGRIVLVDLGKAVGILLSEDQIPGEKYTSGERIKVYVREVSLKPKGPEILLSRTSDEILRKVFYLEIPEISNGLIELKSVAREAGYRSKVAAFADSDNVDPIGSCVGQRGARIQTIINELGGEKVDIIQYDENPVKFISNALSPAKILGIDIDEKEKKAVVTVSADQLSLAIGKGGQNARLAAKLTGWRIDITEEGTQKGSQKIQKDDEGAEDKKSKKDKDNESTENTKTPKENKSPTGQAQKHKNTKNKKDEKEDKKKKDEEKNSKKKKEDKKAGKKEKKTKDDNKKVDKKDKKAKGKEKKEKK